MRLTRRGWKRRGLWAALVLTSPIDRMVAEGDGGLTIGCCMAFGPDEHLYISTL